MNPLDKANARFNFAGTNARVQARNGKDGPVYRVSFEVDQITGEMFMGANLTGKIYGGQLMLIDPDTYYPTAIGQEPTFAETEHRREVPMEDCPIKGGNRSKDAAMLCQYRQFQEFASQQSGNDVCEENAVSYLKWRCQIDSRKELDHDPEAEARFRILYREYGNWLSRVADSPLYDSPEQ